MSQLRGSSTRFMVWGKENAHFISVVGLTAGTLVYLGGSYFCLRSDLQQERELRQLDAAFYKELLRREKELRQLAVVRSERKLG